MVRYLIMDVDGSLTDGKIYMGPEGEAMKAFSIKDGYVFHYILKPAGIVPVIITARNSSIVQNRCAELGIEEVYQGKLDKLAALQEIVDEGNMNECAYFGDDIIDMKCMLPIKKAGGIVGCPSDAVFEVKAVADYVCKSKAGEGALREFAEWLVKPRMSDEKVYERVNAAIEYLKDLAVSDLDINKKTVVNDTFDYYVQSYMMRSEQECFLVSHQKHIVIQMIKSGKEIIEIADIARLRLREKYDGESDAMRWEGISHMTRIALGEGDYVILYPENAYRDVMTFEDGGRVIKIFARIKI